MTDHGVSPLPRQARLYQGRRAGLVTRLVAATLDILLVLLAVLVGYATWAALLFLFRPRGFHLPVPGLYIVVSVIVVVLVGYLTVCWWVTGRSYGSLVMGVRVTDPLGHPARLPVALARAVLYALFPIGLLWVAFDRHSRSVQDLILRTLVVYDWLPHHVSDRAEPGGRSGGR